jgi:hypothetical protein
MNLAAGQGYKQTYFHMKRKQILKTVLVALNGLGIIQTNLVAHTPMNYGSSYTP